MIPSKSGLLKRIKIKDAEPTKTHKMYFKNYRIKGHCEKHEAMKQLIYKILNTERYDYIIYSWNYGLETKDLFGEPVSYVCLELKRRITEALTQDSRIKGVDNFEFETQKGVVHVTFTAHTLYGDINAEKEVIF